MSSTDTTGTDTTRTHGGQRRRPDPLAEVAAELEAQRARADRAEALNTVREAAMHELSAMAGLIRCLAADLCDDALSTAPIHPDRLRHVTERLARRTDVLVGAAYGYLEPAVEDWDLPDLAAELQRHGWTESDPWSVNGGTVPPRPDDGRHNVGDRRNFVRGEQELILWFTSPTRVSCGLSCERTLTGPDDLHAVITSPAITAQDMAAMIAKGSRVEPFDGDHDQVTALLVELGWSATRTTRCNAHGVDQADGPGVKTFWTRPPSDVRIYSHGLPGEPARVWNWIGNIGSMADLRRSATRENPQRGRRR